MKFKGGKYLAIYPKIAQAIHDCGVTLEDVLEVDLSDSLSGMMAIKTAEADYLAQITGTIEVDYSQYTEEQV